MEATAGGKDCEGPAEEEGTACNNGECIGKF